MVGRDLVLLTAAFPYGNKSETFLESEIEILARRFRRIVVLPSRKEAGLRPMPANAELVEMPWLDEPARRRRYAALASPEAVRVLTATLSRPANARPYLGGARMYLDNLARSVLKARELEAFVQRRDLSSALFYDYWFENSTLALALLRHSGAVTTAVARAHGFDLYDDRWEGLRVPFRDYKMAHVDRVFAVSEFGAAYMKARVEPHGGKVEVSRLGVREQPPGPEEPAGDVPLVVSCGSMEAYKRVHCIPPVLEALDMPVRWVHFGDGSLRNLVEAEARRLPERVSWTLMGHVDNAALLRFYRHNRVGAFLSLSIQEGLPVSMMEAISFGVPLVATAVKGVPEIVQEATGVRLEPDACPDRAAGALRGVLLGDGFDRERIRAFFRSRFEASSNYNAFADALLDLQ